MNQINSCKKKKKGKRKKKEKFICFHCGFICSTEKNIYNNKSVGVKIHVKESLLSKQIENKKKKVAFGILRMKIFLHSKL